MIYTYISCCNAPAKVHNNNSKHDYYGTCHIDGRYQITLVPSITNICYGRGVGYKIENIVLPENIQKISATDIRKRLRDEGKL